MKPYADYTRSERCAEYAALQEQYDAWKAKGLSLNMARGKPSRTQLDMVSGILTVLQIGGELPHIAQIGSDRIVRCVPDIHKVGFISHSNTSTKRNLSLTSLYFIYPEMYSWIL